jgi:hypothetical protein
MPSAPPLSARLVTRAPRLGRSFAVLAALALPAALGHGCTCGSVPPEPAPVAAASAAPLRCPEPPDWAENPPDRDRLVAELIHQPDTDAARKGSGVRVYDDGKVWVFEEVNITFKDGKVTTERVDPVWRLLGVAAPARLDDLRRVIAAAPADELVDVQGKNRKGRSRPSFLHVRRSDAPALLRSCFRGSDGGTAQSRIDEVVKKIAGEVGDAARARAAASTSGSAASSAAPRAR